MKETVQKPDDNVETDDHNEKVKMVFDKYIKIEKSIFLLEERLKSIILKKQIKIDMKED